MRSARSCATTIGWPLVGTTLASAKPMSFNVAAHHWAAVRQLALYAGSVETLSIRKSSNRRPSPAALGLPRVSRTASWTLIVIAFRHGCRPSESGDKPRNGEPQLLSHVALKHIMVIMKTAPEV